MPRRIIFQDDGGLQQHLLEVLAENEAELQSFLINNPNLFPVEEIGLTDSIMVVGRESVVPSGLIDMVAIARTGEVLVIEFKTGPGNPDFRRVIAQLFDYGSHLWGMSYEQFETEAVRFFTSDRCSDPKLKDKTSLAEAAISTWSDLSEGESIPVPRQIGLESLGWKLLLHHCRSGLHTRDSPNGRVLERRIGWPEIIRSGINQISRGSADSI